MIQTNKVALQSSSFSNPLEGSRFNELARLISKLPGPQLLHEFVSGTYAIAEPPAHCYHCPLPQNHISWNCESVKVLSANLWHDWPRYRRLKERLEAFIRLVITEKADILLLQEVARTPDLKVDEWLADRLGMAYVYARANGHLATNGFEEGLAVFSRFPLVEPELYQLSNSGFPVITRRMALGVRVKSSVSDLLAVSTHLGIGAKKNARQLVRLQNWVSNLAGHEPAIIGGDFNVHENKQRIKDIKHTWLDTYRYLHPKADGTTYQFYWPWGSPMIRFRLDYLFFQQGNTLWDVADARLLDTPGLPHSDHRAILANLVSGHRIQ